MGLSRTIDALVEPILKAEVKKNLEIATSVTTHDDQIDRLIIRARNKTERMTRRAWINQTWKLTLSRFPESIQLPRPPAVSVTTLQYVDSDGTTKSLVENTDFLLRTNNQPGIIEPYYSQSWPSTHSQEPEAVIITYVAGYGTKPSDVPDEAKQAIVALTTYWFVNRDHADVPDFITDLLSSLHCGMKFGAYEVIA